MTCLLCEASQIIDYSTKKHHLFQCQNCDLIFKSPELFLNFSQQKLRYDYHQNDPEDIRYQNFLQPIVNLVIEKQNNKHSGLDFGCGPGPCISHMLIKHQIHCHNYDPIYFDDKNLLVTNYDFITCTEVVEHFTQPKKSWKQLIQLLNEKANLYIMTSEPPEYLENWHYLNDDTHLCFYSIKAMHWIANKYSLYISNPQKNIYLLSRIVL